ncbi:calreticulin 3 [Podila horticola]|nr:calreticulin 3 [Podila horticola]
MKTTLLASLAIATLVSATTYLEETFSDDKWQDRWTISSANTDLGVFEISSGSWYADKDYSRGLRTTQDVRFYSASTPLSATFDNSNQDLIVQYTVKQEIHQECGGSYLKLLPAGYDAATFNGESEYAIMFGPDVCGAQTRVHVILSHNGKNFMTKKEFPVPKDTKTHLYRLIVHPDQKYSLMLDGDLKVDKVPLEEHWDILGSKTIPDPTATKPKDWVDVAKIVDPSHVKPANYDDIPRYIPDPDATQPTDWDAEADGDWEPAEIPNPEFEEWAPKMMDNPAYKGEWKAEEVPNPEYKEDPDMAHYKIGGVGLDLWQVNSGSIFDDIVVTSEIEVADKYLEQWRGMSKKEDVIVAKIEEEEKQRKEAEEVKAKDPNEGSDEGEKDELDEDDEEEEEASEDAKIDAEVEAKADAKDSDSKRDEL